MFLITKISITVTVLMMVTMMAVLFGYIDQKSVNYIFIIGLSIQIIILAIFIAIILAKRDQLKRSIKIIRYKSEDRYVKAETEILPKHIGPTNPRKSSIFKIYFELKDFKDDRPPNFDIFTSKGEYVKITDSRDIKERLLNINIGISDDLFIFNADMIVSPDQHINFRFKDDANIKKFFVGEVYIP